MAEHGKGAAHLDDLHDIRIKGWKGSTVNHADFHEVLNARDIGLMPLLEGKYIDFARHVQTHNSRKINIINLLIHNGGLRRD